VVRNDGQFTEYTGGGTKDRIRDLMSSGDVGHFDDEGRLFVTGRADDMIVSGGENVFPLEVEEVLLSHDDVVDVLVVGVPDDEFGQRLAAFVVRRRGGSVDADGIRSFVSARLARHKVPATSPSSPNSPATPPANSCAADGVIDCSNALNAVRIAVEVVQGRDLAPSRWRPSVIAMIADAVDPLATRHLLAAIVCVARRPACRALGAADRSDRSVGHVWLAGVQERCRARR
jgi:hypothetical protein